MVWLGIVWDRMAWYGLVCTGMERHGTAHTRRVTGLSVSAARGEVVVVETGESTGVLEGQREVVVGYGKRREKRKATRLVQRCRSSFQ